MISRTFAALALVSLLSACGSEASSGGPSAGGSAVSCNLPDAYCVVYSGTLSSTFVDGITAACTSSGGTAGTSCPAAGKIGSCQASSGGLATTYTFYAPATAADGQAFCRAQSGSWVP